MIFYHKYINITEINLPTDVLDLIIMYYIELKISDKYRKKIYYKHFENNRTFNLMRLFHEHERNKDRKYLENLLLLKHY